MKTSILNFAAIALLLFVSACSSPAVDPVDANGNVFSHMLFNGEKYLLINGGSLVSGYTGKDYMIPLYAKAGYEGTNTGTKKVTVWVNIVIPGSKTLTTGTWSKITNGGYVTIEGDQYVTNTESIVATITSVTPTQFGYKLNGNYKATVVNKSGVKATLEFVMKDWQTITSK